MGILIPDSDHLRRAAAARYHRDLLTLARLELTPVERVTQAQKIRESYEVSNSILEELEKDSKVDPAKQKIIAEYARGGIRGAVESISNFSVRLDYIKAIGKSSQDFLQQLGNAATVEQAKSIVEQAVMGRNTMRELMFAEVAESVRAKHKAAMSVVTKSVKDAVWPGNPKTLDNLVAKLCEGKDFAAMTDKQKLEVYEKLLKNSGKPGLVSTAWSGLQSVIKPAMLVITCTLILNEMSESWNPTETAVRGMVKLGTDYVAAELGLMAGVAVGINLKPLLAIAFSANLAGPLGTVVAVLVSTYVFTKVGNAAVDLVCDSFFQAVSPRIPGFMRGQLEGGVTRQALNVSLHGQTMSYRLDGGADLLRASLLPA